MWSWKLLPLDRVFKVLLIVAGHSAGIFGGGTALGATIVDGMDTLWIMGLTDRFQDGKNWIADHLNFDLVSRFHIPLL